MTSNETFQLQPIWRFNRKRSCTSINPGAYLLPEINLEMRQQMFQSPSRNPVEEPVENPIEDRIEIEDASDDVVVGLSQGIKKENDKKDDDDEENDDDDDKPAEGFSSMGWVLGGGNQLGMFEMVDRDLRVYDYTAINGNRFRVSPGYAMRFLSGPDTTDLPPYLFSIFADVGMGLRMGQNWFLDGIISPSWNTDFANKGYKLFRLPWQVVNTFQVSHELKIVLGVTDLARQDIRVLPVAGVSYSDGSKQFDLIFPRPKMAWLLSHRDNDSHWGYIAGELGGGSFSILREDRQNDIVTLRDYRLLAGLEHRSKNRHSSRLEAGWVFGRAVEYQSNRGNYHPDDTMIIRLSSDY